MIFDSHAHYDDAAFDGDRDTLLEALHTQHHVAGILNAGCDAASSRRSIELAEHYPFIYAAVGWHPENAAAATPASLAALEPLYAHPKVVAIGEVGLDYHYEDACPREQQRRCFEQQLQTAVRLQLPVIVHDREAHGDTLELLKKYRPSGVLHCFSGSVEMMNEVLSLGMYIGLGGAVTFKNARKPVAVAAAVPADRFLLETDCPYMAPVPLRGQRCDSSMIAHTAACIASLRGETTEAILAQSRQNIHRLFGI